VTGNEAFIDTLDNGVAHSSSSHILKKDVRRNDRSTRIRNHPKAGADEILPRFMAWIDTIAEVYSNKHLQPMAGFCHRDALSRMTHLYVFKKTLE
jgi:hypothetical protein